MKFDSTSICPSCDCQEFASLCAMVDAFAEEMKEKLLAKLDEGMGGWDDPAWKIHGEDGIRQRMESHFDKGDPVDVANFACFWWNRLPQEEKCDDV